MKKIELLVFLLISAHLFSQEIYIVNNVTQLKIIDLGDFSVTDLFTLGITTSDLAFTADGQLYGVTSVGEILEIDLISESYSIIGSFPAGDFYTSLVANSNNELLSSSTTSQELYSYNIANGTTTLITGGIATSGDFTFFKGNLIYPNFNSYFIKGYDGSVILNVGCAVNQLYTFVNVFDDCQNENIYGIDNLGRIFNYDIGNEDFEQIASVGIETGNVFGGATISEYLASTCDIESLNTVTCTLSLEVAGSIKPFRVFPNPASNEVFIESDLMYLEYRYNLYDVNGAIILSNKINEGKISIETLEAGIYFIRFMNDNNQIVFTKRLLKK